MQVRTWISYGTFDRYLFKIFHLLMPTLRLSQFVHIHNIHPISGAPLERVPRVPGNPSILGKAKQNTKILRKPFLNFEDF